MNVNCNNQLNIAKEKSILQKRKIDKIGIENSDKPQKCEKIFLKSGK